jgi:hypothetical protein
MKHVQDRLRLTKPLLILDPLRPMFVSLQEQKKEGQNFVLEGATETRKAPYRKFSSTCVSKTSVMS